MSIIFEQADQWIKLLKENFAGEFYNRRERADDPVAGDVRNPSFYVYPGKTKASPSDFYLDFRLQPMQILIKWQGTGEGETSDENDQEAIELQRWDFNDKLLNLVKDFPTTGTDCYKVDMAQEVDLYYVPTDPAIVEANKAIPHNRILFTFDHHTVRRY